MKINRWCKLVLRCGLIVVGVLSLCHCSAQKNQKETERYILDSERQWAESVATGDTSAIERILADDFVGVDPNSCSTTSNRWSPTPGTRRNTTFPIGSMTSKSGSTVTLLSRREVRRGKSATANVAGSSGPTPGLGATADGKSSLPKI